MATRHLLGPQCDATRSQLGVPEAMVMKVAAAPLDDVVGRPRLHDDGHERKRRLVLGVDDPTPTHASRFEDTVDLAEGLLKRFRR